MTTVKKGSPVSRRHVLGASMIVAASVGLSACAIPAASPPTVAPPAPTKAPAAPTTPPVAPTAAPSAPTQAPAVPAATKAPVVPSPAAGPKRGGTFTMARAASVINLNPLNLQTGHYGYIRAMFETLVRLDVTLKPLPGLATAWDFSSDGKTMTLKLREGVKYHTGREFTSADVKATWEVASTDDQSIMRSLYQSIKAVETPEKYRAVLKFDTVNPGVFDTLDVMYIIDKETFADRTKSANGTGPFKLDRYVPNDRLEMLPFKDYWDQPKPYLDKYIVRDIPDTAALSINLESSAVDCIWMPNYQDLVRLRDSGGKYTINMGAPGAVMYDILVNCTTPPFSTKKVRQALAWSIDRARFCKVVLQGMAEPTPLIWPSNSWAYFKDLEGKLGYDLDKAKALLTEAGFPSGFDTELVCSPKTAFGMRELAQILQADVKKIGINLKITEVEPAGYATRIQQQREFAIATQNYGRVNCDPGSVFSGARVFVNDKGGGWSRFNSADYDRLVVELQSSMDQEKRKGICRQIQELILDECPVCTVAPQYRAWAFASYVKGFGFDLDNIPYVGEIWLDK